MRISVDERDILTVYDLEYYVKEREYLLNCQEYHLFMKLIHRFSILEMIYYKYSLSSFKIAVSFANGTYPFWVWTHVNANDFSPPRKRIMLKNSDQLLFLEDYYFYFKERNFLINTREFLRVMYDPYNLTIVKREFSCENVPDHLKNQAMGVYSMTFKKNEEEISLSTYLGRYNPYALERRRDV